MGNLLKSMLPRSQVGSERTRTITGQPGKRPDILITAPGRSPVVIEAEYLPARDAEKEAKERLGLQLEHSSGVIEAAIALRYPKDVAEANDLTAALKASRLSYCVFTGDAEKAERFPETGWLEGAVEDLADVVRLVSVSQSAVTRASAILEGGIEWAAKHLDVVNKRRPGITGAIARLLGMSDVTQTRRMACAIIANALVFHEQIAGMRDDIKSLEMVVRRWCGQPQA